MAHARIKSVHMSVAVIQFSMGKGVWACFNERHVYTCGDDSVSKIIITTRAIGKGVTKFQEKERICMAGYSEGQEANGGNIISSIALRTV